MSRSSQVSRRAAVLLAVGLLALAEGGSPAAADGFGHIATFRIAPGGHVPEGGLSFSADGSLLFAAGSVIDLSRWQWLGELGPRRRGPTARILPIPGGDRLLLASEDGVSLWEMNPPRSGFRRSVWGTPPGQGETGGRHPFAKRLPTPEGLAKVFTRSFGVPLVAFSPDGKRLAVLEGEKVVVRDPGTGEAVGSCEVGDLSSHGRFLAFTGPTGSPLIFGSAHTQYTWDLKSPFARPMPSATSTNARYRWFTLAPAVGRLVGGLGHVGRELVIWDGGGTREPTPLTYRPDQGASASCAAVTPDGLVCFLGHERGVVRRLDLLTGAVENAVLPAETRYGDVRAIAVTPDGKRLAWTDGENGVHVAEVGGRRLPLGDSNEFFPTAVGTTWIYKETRAGRQPEYLRRRVIAHEILGAARCVLIESGRQTVRDGQTVWRTDELTWFAVRPEGIDRAGGGDAVRLGALQLQPIPVLPRVWGGEKSGRLKPEWMDSNGRTHLDGEIRWAARRLPETRTVLNASRDVNEVDSRDKYDRLERSRYATGIGLFEVESGAGLTELQSFTSGEPVAAAAAPPLPVGSVWKGRSERGNWKFDSRLTITARAGDTFHGELWVTGANGKPGRSTAVGRIDAGDRVSFETRPDDRNWLGEVVTGRLSGETLEGSWRSLDPKDAGGTGTFTLHLIR